MTKTTITAKFSNGHTTEYKGTRAVKAAWLITCKATGEVMAKGYSMDEGKALRTAEGKCSDIGHSLGVDLPNFYWVPRALKFLSTSQLRNHLIKRVRKTGLADHIEQGKLTSIKAFKIAKDATKAYNQAARAAAKIEIVNL